MSMLVSGILESCMPGMIGDLGKLEAKEHLHDLESILFLKSDEVHLA